MYSGPRSLTSIFMREDTLFYLGKTQVFRFLSITYMCKTLRAWLERKSWYDQRESCQHVYGEPYAIGRIWRRDFWLHRALVLLCAGRLKKMSP